MEINVNVKLVDADRILSALSLIAVGRNLTPAEPVASPMRAEPVAMAEPVDAAEPVKPIKRSRKAKAEAVTKTAAPAPAEDATKTVEPAPAEEVVETAAPAEAVTKTAEPAPAEEVVETAAPVADAAPTLKDLQGACVALARVKGGAYVLTVIRSFGYAGLSKVPAEKYPELLAILKKEAE